MTRQTTITTVREAPGAPYSRRQALALMLAASPALAAPPAAPEPGGPLLRLGISDSIVVDVNISDARAAMRLYLQTMARDWGLRVEYAPNVFETTLEIHTRIRKGTLDAVTLNAIEYLPVMDCLDSSVIVGGAGPRGFTQHVILTKQSGKFRNLGDLRGRRLIVFKSPRMCLAPAWLDTVLDEGHHGLAEQFFGSLAMETKAARVILPVFFGQAEACLTQKVDFETMSELNPQLARDLTPIAVSPPLLTVFHAFRRSYQGAARQAFLAALQGLTRTPAGKQLATLFQFEDLEAKGPASIASALAIVEKAERLRGGPGAGRKG